LLSLAALVLRRNPRRIICSAIPFTIPAARAVSGSRPARLASLQRGTRVDLDQRQSDPELPAQIDGDIAPTFPCGLHFRHQPVAGEARGQIAGHLHRSQGPRTGREVCARRAFGTDGARRCCGFGVLAAV